MLSETWLWPLIALLGGYLLGSIPFGVLLTRAAGAGDLRQIGSGNIGATNVLRTGRKGLAALTLLLDGAKGAAAVLIAAAISPDLGAPAAAGAFFGHLYPVWLGFRGGKGVATLLGIALALLWPAGIAFAVVWIGAALISRYSSVGGMAAACMPPVVAAVMGQFPLVLLFLAFALMVLWKHRGNLERLLAGTEPRIGAKSAG
ncbi:MULTISPECIES: glycerol-3-phosphate 1-O-acyltransferase PlsY [Sphingomonadales]|uniref:Glycerol-3-phosphate acyltransferase n=2 Tax=Edaphosphingomonas TaxID=3423724 RepID=A0A2T4HR96_9SPHN|nr:MULTISPECIES: glycerol-3-phosphate 1-O-acyltransferase PlsY [Sphingomonas]AGH48540.1 putative membrane protein YgiH [Sphingomonas sp. MM-1]MDX3883282.1 glycerol-3-phosphate 1-O-acyltransferase PlsY [Sphingomonas sp.]OHT21016.1 putative glycerol-3-phosphate acyltransferase [Sphingomonas haloaromaticamans]PTD18314.1 acyl-phosphate glycerol 3-phosphate acyltransferase [Sphingomonas fennica]